MEKKGGKEEFLLYLGAKICFLKKGGGGKISIIMIIYTPGGMLKKDVFKPYIKLTRPLCQQTF